MQGAAGKRRKVGGMVYIYNAQRPRSGRRIRNEDTPARPRPHIHPSILHRIGRTCTFLACLATSTSVDTCTQPAQAPDLQRGPWARSEHPRRGGGVGSGAARAVCAWGARERASRQMSGARAGRVDVSFAAREVECGDAGMVEEAEEVHARRINPLTHPANHIACSGNTNASSAETTRPAHHAQYAVGRYRRRRRDGEQRIRDDEHEMKVAAKRVLERSRGTRVEASRRKVGSCGKSLASHKVDRNEIEGRTEGTEGKVREDKGGYGEEMARRGQTSRRKVGRSGRGEYGSGEEGDTGVGEEGGDGVAPRSRVRRAVGGAGLGTAVLAPFHSPLRAVSVPRARRSTRNGGGEEQKEPDGNGARTPRSRAGLGTETSAQSKPETARHRIHAPAALVQPHARHTRNWVPAAIAVRGEVKGEAGCEEEGGGATDGEGKGMRRGSQRGAVLRTRQWRTAEGYVAHRAQGSRETEGDGCGCVGHRSSAVPFRCLGPEHYSALVQLHAPAPLVETGRNWAPTAIAKWE
ncbi:hypothetical protein B0H17DRAFT_1184186 [Mycena rosella]|uniref:Uncharacterized protein n=1 Tax=Mycena rosella TaxID=1033263 RepID=A0AAD7CX34_MYCRO|nr:hypothetical protein B0H17DRAFT_1184186 [Mycena rosella]